jgi:hypothetical protein
MRHICRLRYVRNCTLVDLFNAECRGVEEDREDNELPDVGHPLHTVLLYIV